MAHSRKMNQVAHLLGQIGMSLICARGRDNQKPWRVQRKGDASGEHYRFSNLDEVQAWLLKMKSSH